MFEIAGIVYCCNDSSGQHKSIVVRSCSECCPERSCIANYKVKQTTDYLTIIGANFAYQIWFNIYVLNLKFKSAYFHNCANVFRVIMCR